MAAEAVQSYSLETLKQIEKIHGRLARYLSKNGEPDFAQLGVTAGVGDRIIKCREQLERQRQESYETPVIGGIRHFIDIISSPLAIFSEEAALVWVGVTVKALEEVARESSLKQLTARFKPGQRIILKSIKLDLPSDPDYIFRTGWWETETLEDYPLTVTFINISFSNNSPETQEARLPKIGKINELMGVVIMPPGPRIAESCTYNLWRPNSETAYQVPLGENVLIRLSRLPMVLGQRRKSLHVTPGR